MPVVMETDHLRIEALTPGHADVMFDALRAPGLYTFIDEDPPATREALTRRYEHLAAGSRGEETWRNWVTFSRDTGAPVGTLQATEYVDGRALIAYLVLPAFQGRGRGTEAVTWMLAYLRAYDGITRAEALIDTRNVASIWLVERLGFTRVETIPNAAVVHGAPSDEYRYAKQLD